MVKRSIKKITPGFILSAYHLSLAYIAALWYRFPSEAMVVVGVTGTKGKSSVVFMLAKILEEAGIKVGVSSSLMFKINENEWLNPYHMTMAGRFKLQQFLYQAKNAGCTHVIIETTSEGIKQHRHRFINFDVAVFTNLTPEHIEAHGGFENYKRAKGKLFEALANASHKSLGGKSIEKISVGNTDDEHAAYFLSFPADKTYGFSVQGKCALPPSGNHICVSASAIIVSPEGVSFDVENAKVQMHLLGQFNVENALCAAVTAKSLGVDFSVSAAALAKIEEIPGRMKFIREGQKFTTIIDFAHTPSSFEGVFAATRKLKDPHGRLIAVFGSAGGGRDVWKRPELGKIAARNADHIILTADDPYEEDIEEICAAIRKGIDAESFQGKVEIISNRQEAIKSALGMARWNDIVLLLGKGTEQTLMIGNESIPWNEEGLVIEEIRNMLYDQR
ncbi:MAG: UDP-N-acetylmuramoyl-L-alanyl-D-glutamate--2,6-diaminopimelate ligase [Candidatus Azambacteria bacterium]|nr:UDP-N-acetylmuramoyl-L-alanyl-D-glutamate--2,6-diaminopimelate ligase [Candidatus Azambacteria bacterium]